MPQLSCEQCRLRKVKCDKGTPCSSCKASDLRCNVVERARRPRGRSGKVKIQKGTLDSRISRIEALLQQTAANASCGVVNRYCENGAQGRAEGRPLETIGNTGNFIDFWSALSQEVAGVREILEDSDEDEDSPTSQSTSGCSDQPMHSTSVLFACSPATHSAFTQIEPTKDLSEMLLDIYRIRIDTVFKPLHWPTVLTIVEKRYSAAQGTVAKASHRALEIAVYFTAICSLQDHECEQIFRRPKTSVAGDYCSATERYVAASGVLESPDVIGLQAFVIYLQGLRMYKGHALNWTLTAVAVRLAGAIGLGSESTTMPHFDLEVRRRLWYSICLMDTQATLDRGSIPLVPASALGPPPLYIDDNEISPTFVPKEPLRPSLDMLFSSMVYEAMVCHKRMCELQSGPQDNWQGWARKVDIVTAFERTVQTRYCTVEDATANPIEVFTKYGAHSIAANMQLLLRRPPYRQAHNAVPPWDDFNSMQAATEVLERDLRACGDPSSPWAWKEWTPWYALGVCLAELCRTPAGEAADRTYAAACATFRRYAPIKRASGSDTLWRPIAKLLRRVTQLRTACSPSMHDGAVMLDAAHNNTRPVDKCSLDTASDDMTSTPSVGGQCEPQLDIDWDMWITDDTTNGLNDSIALQDYAMPEMLDLNPENGVSFLDWDLLL